MTTLNQIRSHSPCQEGWTKLLAHLSKTKADDEPLSLLTVLESNGLGDAIWCLRTELTPERTHRFALAVARRAEHLSPAARADATDSAADAAYAAACAAYGVGAAYGATAYAAEREAQTQIFKETFA